ncbi:MAG TPA: poly-gamma-glutamate biosynthesis protein PgsC [Spirochaetota bacterium]|nr:poly-gamma-glutamate biosynthesis protein PgsC [Spirochaetota bacterium]HPI90032.1 poly-gamma-glutamate biosynthesis protein PgsC [Spirochaetota bacterium]HPR48086.1 poly-gamma-glutamate biosynthesis protein PgsC [Spirochaetota bacterium]
MEELITLSISLGLMVSLVFSEMLGIAAGGMVVPGYVALYLNNPLAVLTTIILAYATYFITTTLGTVMIIYGRRRTVIMILVGFLLGWLTRSVEVFRFGPESLELNVIGYIITGLIAIWMDRQGVIETIAALITSSVIVRLILILIMGKDIAV